MRRSGLFWVGAVLIGALIIGGLVGFVLTRGNDPRPAPTVAQNHRTDAPSPSATTTPVVIKSETEAAANISAAIVPPPSTVMFDKPEVIEAAEWETALEATLSGEGTDLEKAQQIRMQLKTAPEPARPELLQHVLTLTPDDQYAANEELLLNVQTQEEELEILVADLLNRGNEVKLPALLKLAQAQNHPMQDEALEMMQLFLEADHGKDWFAWTQTMQKWIKEQRDAEAASASDPAPTEIP